MLQYTPALGDAYARDFHAMKINPARHVEALAIAHKIASGKARYETVSKATGVPWFAIGIWHEREASLDFTKFLGDGEPLNRATVNVPAHMGPFKDFETGAIAAILHEGFEKVKIWDLGSVLVHSEMFNGPGYHNMGKPSPYVWSWSDKYTAGKYGSDGRYSASLIDEQCGCAVMLSALLQIGAVTLDDKGNFDMVAPSTATASAPVQTVATAGVNISTSTLVSHLLGSASSLLVTIGAPVLAIAQGTTWGHWALGGLFGIAGLGSLVSQVFSMISGNTAASNNTLAVINQISSGAAQMLAAVQAAQSMGQPNPGIAQPAANSA